MTVRDEDPADAPELFDFVQRYLEDKESAAVRPLADYLQQFEALAPAVEREFHELEAWRTTPPGVSDQAEDRLLGPYRILRLLGSGGQGTVYAAADTRVDRKVALKILNPGFAGVSEAAVRRFLHEAEAVARLDDPGICPVYEADRDAGVPYIAMQLLDGTTLREAIAREHRERAEAGAAQGRAAERDRIRQAASIVERLARTLHTAHEAGVIHRDVKPGNVMITRDGRPVILDFGLARIDDGNEAMPTQTGAVFGTPAYMAPELLQLGARKADARADVYSLGATLYEWVAGRPPFVAATREALFQSIVAAEAPDLRALNPATPRDLAVVVATALEKDLARRYHSALAFAEDLGCVLRSESIRARPSGPIVRVVRWSRRRPALAAAIAASVLGLAATLFFWRKAEQAVAEYDIVAGATEIAHLRAAAEHLWPADPAHAEALRDWMKRAKLVTGRLPELETMLAGLRASATRGLDPAAPDTIDEPLVVGSDGGELVPAFDAPDLSLRFADVSTQFKHDVLSEYVRGLRRFVDTDPARGLIVQMGRRLAFAESVVARTVENHRDAWDAAIAAIADPAQCPAYAGLKITRQPGLVPIGRDATSFLYEFVDLYTSEASRENPVPARKPDGSLAMGKDTGVVFVLIPGGVFRMGSVLPDDPDRGVGSPIDPEATGLEKPVNEVRLAPFFLSKYEMTQSQWRRVTGTNPSFFLMPEPATPDGGKPGDLPLEFVSWIECDRWLRRLGFALPTEAQWEYAARAGTTTPWSSGARRESLRGGANLAGTEFRTAQGYSRVLHEAWTDGYEAPWPVGTGAPNAFGLHDVHGNVFEWCEDDLVVYDHSATREGDGLRTGSDHRGKVHRGGSWLRDAHWSRSASRLYNRADYRRNEVGVRPARPLASGAGR